MNQTPAFIDDFDELSPMVRSLRQSDPEFEELVADYKTLLKELQADERADDATASRFVEDAKASLAALEQEIRKKLADAIERQEISGEIGKDTQ